MAYKVPDKIKSGDPSDQAVADINDVTGVSFVADTTGRDSINSDVRSLNFMCKIGSVLYSYNGADISNGEWQDDGNWEIMNNGYTIKKFSVSEPMNLTGAIPAGHVLKSIFVDRTNYPTTPAGYTFNFRALFTDNEEGTKEYDINEIVWAGNYLIYCSVAMSLSKQPYPESNFISGAPIYNADTADWDCEITQTSAPDWDGYEFDIYFTSSKIRD